MNNAHNIMKSPESETSNMASLGGSVLTEVGSEDKKSISVVLQKHVLSPTSAKNTIVEPICEPGTAGANNYPIPKITAFGSLSQNGKFVQVQTGSLLNTTPLGGIEVARQKVLLASVTSNPSSPMARMILPRQSPNNVKISSPPTKQICRSFSMIPCPQGTIVSPITVKSPDGASKIIQPNIIRPRSFDGKIITSSSGVPLPQGIIVPAIPISSGILLPGKSPSPKITLIKPAGSQLSKIIGFEKRETEEKPQDIPQPVPQSAVPKPVEDNVPPAGNKKPEESDIEIKLEESDAEIKLEQSDVEIKLEESNVEIKLEEPDCTDSVCIKSTRDAEKTIAPIKEKEDSKDCIQTNIIDEPEKKAKGVSLSEINLKDLPVIIAEEMGDPVLLGGVTKKPLPALIPRECLVKEASAIVANPAATTTATVGEGRARKRKGILSSPAVSSHSKGRHVGEVYEYVKLLPGSEDLEPFDIIDWDEDGTGNLPQSTIEFVVTELGLIELNASLNDLEKNRHGKIEDADEIYCCVHCGCYGLITEFYNESYCSIRCKEQLIAQQEALVNFDDLEPFDERDKKKTYETVNPKKSLAVPGDMCKDLSKMGKVVSLLESEFESFIEDDKNSEAATSSVDFEKDSSPSPPRKASPIEPISNKVKKLAPKSKPLPKPAKPSKPPPISVTPTQKEENTNKSKIKLRPRSGIKICSKYSEEIIQDLCMGSASSDSKVSEGKKSTAFRWTSYLSETKGTSAWVKLFMDPFPSKPNRFKVGQKLEAIDPEHQSFFCLVSIAEVKGYRLKLHFDGYPPEYDFWVNANSPNIFPAEFCSSHKIPLHPPPGIPMRSFDWDSYLTRNSARAAPAALFDSSSSESGPKPNLFKVDMKLEAVDRKNTFLVCVSTVAAVMENRILIHFDSWGDMYDYWVDVSSPYIRPVGWCEANGHSLTPPNGVKSDNFSWKKYLKDTKSIPAPEKAFCLRQPIEFKKGMKIEAVDKRAPHFIRVASISAVLPYQVNVTFDGYPSHFGYWVDDDSQDIHPVGWASRSGHPLEPPPTEEDLLDSPCKTPGCMGQGHLKGTKHEFHHQFQDCPYATENLSKDTALTDRLKWSNVKFKQKYGDEFCTIPDDSDEDSDEDIESIRWTWLKVQQDANKLRTRTSEEEEKNITKKYPPQSAKKTKEAMKLPMPSPEAHKAECDSFTDSEEIKQIFGPSSPIPIIDEEMGEASSIENIKTVCEDSEKNSANITDSGNKVEPVDVKPEIKKEIKEEEIEEETCKNEKDIKAEFPNCRMDNGIIKKDIKTEVIDIILQRNNRNTFLQVTTNRYNKYSKFSNFNNMINNNRGRSLKFAPLEDMEVDAPIFNDNDELGEFHERCCKCKVQLNLPKIRKVDDIPHPSQVLIWTPKQVSDYIRSCISSSSDCFVKEDINGEGLLLMNKNDLLEHLGLSDADAVRVFNKIRRLRLKA